MSAEFEAEVRNSMRALQAAVEGVGRAQKKTTDEVARFGSTARAAFGTATTAAGKLEEHGVKGGKAWRELGHALGRIGGPLGEIVAKFGGGFGMEGGLSRIAAAAGLAGLALKALSSVVDKQAEDARKAAEGWQKMTDAIEASHDAATAAAVSAAGQATDRRKVRAVGGQEGIDQMDALTKQDGIGESEAAGGLSAIYGRFGRTPAARAAVTTAKALAQTGVPFDHAAQEIAKRGGDLSQPGAARSTAGRVFNEFYGRLGGGDAGFNQALADTGGDPFLKKAQEVHGLQGQAAGEHRAGVVSGAATTKARGDLAAAKNPAAEALLKIHQQHQKQVDLLQKQIDVSSDLAVRFQNLGLLLGGSGSAEQQLRKLEIQFNEALKLLNAPGDGG